MLDSPFIHLPLKTYKVFAGATIGVWCVPARIMVVIMVLLRRHAILSGADPDPPGLVGRWSIALQQAKHGQLIEEKKN